MRFLPKLWREGMWELWNFWMVGPLLFQYLNCDLLCDFKLFISFFENLEFL
jgi:hypothetical protein